MVNAYCMNLQVGVAGIWSRCTSAGGCLTAPKQDWALGASHGSYFTANQAPHCMKLHCDLHIRHCDTCTLSMYQAAALHEMPALI